jgi:hypothetical protein
LFSTGLRPASVQALKNHNNLNPIHRRFTRVDVPP